MTNSQPSESPRIYLPGVAILLFLATPILLLLGAFLTVAKPNDVGDWVDALPLIGTIMIWAGVAALMCALILEGVRSVAQQQLSILLKERD